MPTSPFFITSFALAPASPQLNTKNASLRVGTRRSASSKRFAHRIRTKAKFEAPGAPDGILYTIPPSNYSARVKYILEKKKLHDRITCRRPEEGLKSPEHLKVSPLGKVPSLLLSTGEFLFESTVIAEYIIARYDDKKPSFTPQSLVNQAKAKLIARVIDLYIGVEHSSMYRAIEGDRLEGIKRLVRGFDVLEKTLLDIGEDGYALGGDEPTLADAALLGNLPYYDFHLKPIYGVDLTEGRPKLAKWMRFMRNESKEARVIYDEVWNSLERWWYNGRYEKLGIKAAINVCPSKP